MLDVDDLRRQILLEAHCSRYSIHPGANKTYGDIQETYWWNGLKRDIVEFVTILLIVNKSRPNIKDYEG